MIDGDVTKLRTITSGEDMHPEMDRDMLAEMAGKKGWKPLVLWHKYGKYVENGHYINSRGVDSDKISISAYYNAEEKRLMGIAYIGNDCQGPPGYAHGGVMTTILDDAMGQCGYQLGQSVRTAYIHVDFKAPIPLGNSVRYEGWIDRVEGRKVYTKSMIYSLAEDDITLPNTEKSRKKVVYGQGNALFIRVNPATQRSSKL